MLAKSRRRLAHRGDLLASSGTCLCPSSTPLRADRDCDHVSEVTRRRQLPL